jgi:hypothetical protein
MPFNLTTIEVAQPAEPGQNRFSIRIDLRHLGCLRSDRRCNVRAVHRECVTAQQGNLDRGQDPDCADEPDEAIDGVATASSCSLALEDRYEEDTQDLPRVRPATAQQTSEASGKGKAQR